MQDEAHRLFWEWEKPRLDRLRRKDFDTEHEWNAAVMDALLLSAAEFIEKFPRAASNVCSCSLACSFRLREERKEAK